MRDLVSNFGFQPAFIGSLSADNTPVAIDRLGYESVGILLYVGPGGITFTNTNKVEFKLTHSDDDITYVDVTDDDVHGVTGVTTGIVNSLKTAHAADTVTKIGYVGDKRYLKLLADFGGTHGSGTPMAGLVVLGHGRSRPVA